VDLISTNKTNKLGFVVFFFVSMYFLSFENNFKIKAFIKRGLGGGVVGFF